MDGNVHEFVCGDEVYAIISCPLAIINFKKPKLEWERIILTQ
jgi:hypothetical protein